MDQIFGKVGSLWFNQKATKELDTVGNNINSVSNTVEDGAKWLVSKVTGKVEKPLSELLKEYDLPIGLFPLDMTKYEFDEATKRLEVHVPAVCEISYKDSSVLRFSTNVSGYLEKGKFTDIEGLKTKVVVWVKVTLITTEGSKLHVTAGLKKTRSRDAYEVQKEGVTVSKF
ncbi:DUF538 domain-containing protein [Heracleum sosnowskyi]|uniref:DUF538 domain-containing protein n=1 Tax=Heracleum sosnowskyi TaxID=360622 RepID=A0AAD8J789_9APIA|nr:DUF538 domain-containing protein [Heracleum sosnowskyi]